MWGSQFCKVIEQKNGQWKTWQVKEHSLQSNGSMQSDPMGQQVALTLFGWRFRMWWWRGQESCKLVTEEVAHLSYHPNKYSTSGRMSLPLLCLQNHFWVEFTQYQWRIHFPNAAVCGKKCLSFMPSNVQVFEATAKGATGILPAKFQILTKGARRGELKIRSLWWVSTIPCNNKTVKYL